MGLLDEHRTCLRGHGPMAPVSGTWALQQVRQNSGLIGGLVNTGLLYTFTMYRCATCGSLEMVDQEAPNGST